MQNLRQFYRYMSLEFILLTPICTRIFSVPASIISNSHGTGLFLMSPLMHIMKGTDVICRRVSFVVGVYVL